MLSIAATQTLYNQAIHSSTRHDLSNQGSGILDSQVAPPWVTPQPWKMMTDFDDAIIAGPMCGACPTADRLYRSDLLPTPKCRWCGADKEDIRHLTLECQGVQRILGSPGRVFDNQPNLYSHGLFEVPKFFVDCWANATGPSSCDKQIFNYHRVTLFGDGSVYNADHFWSKTLGIAVVDQYERIVTSQAWVDPMGCSFKAELCAFRAAAQATHGPLQYVTDCRSISNIWREVTNGFHLPYNMAYRDIWNEILALAFDRDGGLRISVLWIRAHQADRLEHVACPLQRNNKIADFAARQKAREMAPISNKIVSSWRAHIRHHRVWLCKLSKLIQSAKSSVVSEVNDEPSEQSEDEGERQTVNESELQRLQNRFCKWDWNISIDSFSLVMDRTDVSMPKKWQHSPAWWNRTVGFFQQLRWRQCDGSSSAYEMAFNFWFETRMTPPTLYKKSEGVFVLLVDWIRHVMRELKKLSIAICPNYIDFKPRAASWSSQYFPYGTFQGGRFYSSPECRLAFAKFVCSLPNGGKTPKDWAVQLP